MNFGALFTAIKAGEQLANPATWKNRGENINLVGALIAGGIVFMRWKFPGLLPEDDSFVLKQIVDYSAEAIGTILVAVNLYLNRATTTKEF